MSKYIFDLDGTLIDASERLFKLFNYLIPDSTFTKSDYWTLKRDKVNHKMILEKFFPNYIFDIFNKKWLSLIEEPKFLELDCLYDDTIRALEHLYADNELILLTARQKKMNLLEELDNLNIKKYFKKILVTENKLTKEDLLKQISFDSHDYFISDMGKDIALGNKYNLKTIAITHGFMSKEHLIEYKPLYTIENLWEISKTID